MIPGKKYRPEDFLQLAWKRKWLILIPFLVFALGGVIYAYSQPNRYRSETLIMVVPQRVPAAYVQSTVTTRIEDRLRTLQQQIMSRTKLESIIQQFNLYPDQQATGIMEDIVESMRRDITVEIVRGDVFRVQYVSGDPRLAMRVAERLAGLFIEENLQDRAIMAESTNQFLETQLEDARQRLVEHEKKLEAYRMRNTGTLPDQVSTNLQAIQNRQTQAQALVESINRDRDRMIVLERQIADLSSAETSPVSAAAVDPTNPAALAAASTEQQLEAARVALRQLELRLKPEHPDIRRAERIVRDLEKKAEAEALERPLAPAVAPRVVTPEELGRQNRLRDLRAEYDLLERQAAGKIASEQRLRDEIAMYQARVEAAPSRQSELTALMRDYDTLQRQYTTLLTKREDAKLSANLERRQGGEQFRILDPARLPEKPFSPNRQFLMLVSCGLGLGLGLGFVGLLEYRDRSLKTEEDVLVALSLPVLAVIPRMYTTLERQRARRRKLQLSIVGTGAFAFAAGLIVWRFIQWREFLNW